jgi:iron(III) transport system ATP-binding protein
MRTEIRRVCKEHALTTVYVTHDQKEALSISDRMAILDAGRVLQVGTAKEVYRRPHTKTVANFIGETDFVPGTVRSLEGPRAVVDTAVGSFEGVLGDPARRPAVGSAVSLSIRPECWQLGTTARPINTVRGRIGEATYLGELAQYEFIPGSAPDQGLKIVEMNPRFVGDAGQKDLYASAEPEDVVVLID